MEDSWKDGAKLFRKATKEKENAYRRIVIDCFALIAREELSMEEAETAIKRIKSAYDNKVSALLRERKVNS